MSEFDEKYDEILDKVEALAREKKYSELKNEFKELYPTDIAFLMDDMPEEYRLVMFRLLPKDIAADVFIELESDSQEMLIKGFSNSELETILDDMYLDDTVDLIEEMPANVVKRILKSSDPDTRKEINKILQYPEDSAGSLMTTEFIRLRRGDTVADAIEKIRVKGNDSETINVLYVTDESRHLLGYVTIRTLVLEKNTSAKIGDIMDSQIIFVSTQDDKEDVAQQMSKYDFDAMPVVDSENRIVGIVTFDDAIDVMEEEATEDIAKMAGMMPSDKPYLREGILEIFKNRFPWLLVLMLSATFTSIIINNFEDSLKAQAALIGFIPMLTGTGGNSGSQSSTAVIRSLSLGDIETSDILSVIWKEIRVATICGIGLSIVNFGKMLLVDKLILGNEGVTIMIAATVSVTMLFVVIFAKAMGGILPMGAKKVGVDPAVMCGPLMATITDSVSLLVYFATAKLLLHI